LEIFATIFIISADEKARSDLKPAKAFGPCNSIDSACPADELKIE